MSRVSLQEMPSLARSVLGILSGATKNDSAFVIALEGNLGAGKTTLVQTLAKELGVSVVVQSPTYVLMKSYPIQFGSFTTLIHIDAYRLDVPEEFSALKPEKFLNDPHVLVCIEWPERLKGVLPETDMKLVFSHIEGEENMREVEGI